MLFLWFKKILTWCYLNLLFLKWWIGTPKWVMIMKKSPNWSVSSVDSGHWTWIRCELKSIFNPIIWFGPLSHCLFWKRPKPPGPNMLLQAACLRFDPCFAACFCPNRRFQTSPNEAGCPGKQTVVHLNWTKKLWCNHVGKKQHSSSSGKGTGTGSKDNSKIWEEEKHFFVLLWLQKLLQQTKVGHKRFAPKNAYGFSKSNLCFSFSYYHVQLPSASNTACGGLTTQWVVLGVKFWQIIFPFFISILN